MKLELIDEKTRVTADGRYCTRTDYSIGGYAVTEFKSFYSNGTAITNYECTPVRVPGENCYLPEIYYRDNWYDCRVSHFEIQTTSYGALDAEEFKKFLEAQQMAMGVVEVLNREFGKQEGKSEKEV